jgi:endoglucanase
MSFVKVNGTGFQLNGENILFKGLGIGSWLNLEHFMLGIPATDHQIRKAFEDVYGRDTAKSFFDEFIMQFITDADFRFLKENGINLIRVPFNYRLFIDDQNPSEYKQAGFIYLDRLMDLSRKYEIYVLPDLHSAPGGQNPDWHSDNRTGYTQFWHYKAFRDQVVELWKKIAARYCTEPFLLGYDLLNEPFIIPKYNLLDEFYREVTAGIRQVDNNHIIFLEGDFFAMDFSCIHSIEDEQTALTFHYYPTVWETDLFSKAYDRSGRKEKFDSVFSRLVQIRSSFNRPVLCGEAGYDIDKEDLSFTLDLISDTLELFRKYQVSFTLWSYKDAQFMGVVYPSSDSMWMQFAGKIHSFWNHYKDTDMAEECITNLCNTHFPNASAQYKYHMRFSQRALIYHFQAEFWLKQVLMQYTNEQILKMPSSFLFENCEVYREYIKMLREFRF